MVTLYDNAFSPFARKVRIALALKALDHDGVIVVGSSDIVAYLERVWPAPALYPAERAAWVHARAWERCADTFVDPILINVSYWMWAEREDRMPEGMLEAARRDIELVYAALERDLGGGDFVSGALSIADVALFPHVTATRSFGLGHDTDRFPRVHAWLGRLRAMTVFADDLARVKVFIAAFRNRDSHERRKIFWRGDRIEWLVARGFHGWFAGEIAADRALWPGPAIPAPRRADATSR
jgi:glutathione S-transferase